MAGDTEAAIDDPPPGEGFYTCNSFRDWYRFLLKNPGSSPPHFSGLKTAYESTWKNLTAPPKKRHWKSYLSILKNICGKIFDILSDLCRILFDTVRQFI